VPFEGRERELRYRQQLRDFETARI